MLYRSTDRLCRCGAPMQYLSHSASFHSREKYAPPNAGTKQVGFIGSEGIVGGMHLLGPASLPTDCMIQLEASALRILLSDLKAAFNSSDEIRERILEMA